MKIFAVTLFFLIAGCVSAPKHQMTVKFDANEVAFINERGNVTIIGQAFLTRNDGIVVYAAGQDVTLVPAGRYADERISALYGKAKISRRTLTFSDENPEFKKMVRTAKADGEGRFSFKEIANGRYHIVTKVVWKAGEIFQGGAVRETVTITGNQTVEIIMSGS